MAAPCPLLGRRHHRRHAAQHRPLPPHHQGPALPHAHQQLSNSRFATKIIAGAPSGGAVGGAAVAEPEMLCIADEAGRLWLAGCGEQERGWVPRREVESWLCLMHEVELLRLPLVFGLAHGNFTLSEGGAVATKTGYGTWRAAASNVAMRSDRHFAQFTVVESGNMSMFFGVIRAGWDVGGDEWASDEDGHSFCGTAYGRRYPGNHTWEGMQTAKEQGDRIGMLLDLDQGSMTVWKNGELLGVMQAEGLSGPLCWAVSSAYAGSSARIESAPALASPTEEELAAAKAWQVVYG